MSGWIRTIWSRCRAIVTRDRLDREFDEELRTHLELLVDEYRRGGMSAADARSAAIRKLGRPELLREDHREQRGALRLDILAQDLRYAVRMLFKSPAFTAIVTLSLALGIGANTALFSLVDDLLLRSLPLRDPDRLVQVQQTFVGLGVRKVGNSFSRDTFEYLRANTRVFDEIVGFNDLDRPLVAIGGASESGRQVERVSDNFFRDLGVRPILGRTPESSDRAVAIISYGLWHGRFDGNANVLGRTLTVDNQAYTIIGVAPAEFLGLSIENAIDVWVSSRTEAPEQMIARVKRGVAIEQAQAATHLQFRQLAQAQPDAQPVGANLRTELSPAGKGLSQLRGQYERPLLALTVLVTLVLLVTCTNVGNLLMVRNAARRRELTVRVALGARRSRLVMQYFVESAVLAAMGGVLALVLARWGVSIILSMLPLTAIPQGLTFHVDARILSFAAAVSLLCALVFGLVPAWRATQVDLTGALRSSQTTTPTKGGRRLGRTLVACQVGLSVLLLVGAGLFVQTLRNLVTMDVGFNPDRVLQVSLNTRGSGYRQGQVTPLYRLLHERISSIPGVRSVSCIRNPVMRGALSRTRFSALGPGRPVPPNEAWDSAAVCPGFFETLNIPIVRGRTFTDADFSAPRAPIIVNQSFVRHYFPNEDPIGQLDGVLVGVVGDSKLAGVRRDVGPMMYFIARELDRLDALEVRISGDAAAIVPAIREEVRRINPRLLVGLRTMRDEIDRSIAQERMVAATSAFFSVLGLLLASIGVFGVAASTVAQKTTELGIRMALGADRWSVIRESLRDTMLVSAVGLAAGIVAAVAAVRLTGSFIADLLFGLTASDAANIAGAVFVMVVVALAACILPARRATRIDPLAAIRHE